MSINQVTTLDVSRDFKILMLLRLITTNLLILKKEIQSSLKVITFCLTLAKRMLE